MTKKIALINPKGEQGSWWDSGLKLPPYALLLVETFVPYDWDVVLIDERVEPLPSLGSIDLACGTAMTCTAPRLYKIADSLTAKEIPFVLGGFHPSSKQDEASKHGTVVVGPAEGAFPEVLKDYERGKMKRVYYGSSRSLDTPRIPRFDLLRHKYPIQLVQTKQGCPKGCEYCSVKNVYGVGSRYKSLNQVIAEVNATKCNRILFVDDHFNGINKQDRERTIELLKRLRDETSIKYAIQATVDFADDEKLLRYTSESGCVHALMGFESKNPNSLREVKKTPNLRVGVDSYKDGVRKLHDNGLSVSGTFIFGFDSDTRDVFQGTVDFVKDAEIDSNRFEVLTPLPETVLYRRLFNEGRIIYTDYPNDWSRYDFLHANFQPKNMSPKELEFGALEATKETSGSFLTCFERALTTVKNTGLSLSSVYAAGISFLLNKSCGEYAKERLKTI